MSRVAIVTDSASDLTTEQARAAGIRIVPLEVTFGSQRFKAGVDLTTEAFWERMVAPDAPFPTTAAASPGDFRAIFSEMFDAGADAIVCVNVAGTLSGTIKSATIAREMLDLGVDGRGDARAAGRRSGWGRLRRGRDR